MTSPLEHLSTLLWWHKWTTVRWYSPAHWGQWPNATAVTCLVSGTCKCDRELSQIPPADLHWLDVADWVRYMLCVTVHRCRCSIWWTAVFQSQTSSVVNNYILHAVVSWAYHAIHVAHLAVGHSCQSRQFFPPVLLCPRSSTLEIYKSTYSVYVYTTTRTGNTIFTWPSLTFRT